MKKVCVLLLVLMFGTASYGAVSDDVYVRRDVFEVYMQNINANLERIMSRLDSMEGKITEMSDKLSALSERLDGNTKMLSSRMDGIDKRIDELDKRIDVVNTSLSGRIDDLRNGIYLWLVAIGLFVSWPKVKESAQKLVKPAPTFTLEDVERLIDKKLSGNVQA